MKKENLLMAFSDIGVVSSIWKAIPEIAQDFNRYFRSRISFRLSGPLSAEFNAARKVARGLAKIIKEVRFPARHIANINAADRQ